MYAFIYFIANEGNAKTKKNINIQPGSIVVGVTFVKMRILPYGLGCGWGLGVTGFWVLVPAIRIPLWALIVKRLNKILLRRVTGRATREEAVPSHTYVFVYNWRR